MSDNGTFIVVLQIHSKHPESAVVQDLKVINEVIALQQVSDFGLQSRDGHIRPLMPGGSGIADPSEHVGDGVGHHGLIRSFTSLLSGRRGFHPEAPSGGNKFGRVQISG
jgi:hypothetical protein